MQGARQSDSNIFHRHGIQHEPRAEIVQVQKVILEKQDDIYTMSATRAQSWIVVRQGVAWTITCARENILVFAFMLSLIYIKIMYKHSIDTRVNVNTHTNFFTLARV